jgi:flavin-dependent dehydrogenase
VFPKGDHLSIGVLSTASTIRHLKPYFDLFIKIKRLYAHAQVASLRAYLIPQGPDKSNIFADRGVILVGDAAGFADPVTGEGIFFAIREAQIASKVILDCLTLSYEHINEYNNLIKEEFMREMILAKRLAYILYKFPRFSYTIFRPRGRIVGQYYLDIVSGTMSYSELYYKMLNPASIMTFAFGRL